MGKRISADQWGSFKKNHPEIIEAITPIIVDMGSRIFRTNYRRYSVTRNNQTFSGREKKVEFCDKLKDLLDWCDDYLEAPFYAEVWHAEIFHTGYTPNNQGVAFYFFDDDDAMLFKLTWWNI